jgi:hypothetical protein
MSRLLTAIVLLAAGSGCEGAIGVDRKPLMQTTWAYQPDSNGNLALASGAFNAEVHAGDLIEFSHLSPNDNIIEVNEAVIDSDRLCSDEALGTGAHPVVAQSPTPAVLYDNNELSGPYHAYPAGIYVLSPTSSGCQPREGTWDCVWPNERRLIPSPLPIPGSLQHEYLCSVEPNLNDWTGHERQPTQTNPDCVHGEAMESTWADPSVQGVFLRLDWNVLNPHSGVYNFGALRHELMKAVRYGKTVTLGIRVGGNSIPDWVFDPTRPIHAQRVHLRDWGTGPDELPDGNCGTAYDVASPSDPVFQNAFIEMINELGRVVREDQRFFSVVAGIKVTGLGLQTLESRLPKRCNIPVDFVNATTGATEALLISMDSPNLASATPDTDYEKIPIAHPELCICNPQVLQLAGYTPTAVRDFYRMVETAIHDNFGFKHEVFMEIQDGFPQIGDGGRFLGDHLVGPYISPPPHWMGPLASAAPFPSPAAEGTDIPASEQTTKELIADGRNGLYAGNDPLVQSYTALGFGVENAALNWFLASWDPRQKCSQQADIATTGQFAGSASFPIPGTATVDNTPKKHCPQFLAAREGINWGSFGGFQVLDSLEGATEIDGALWNMTLNSNGLFFEDYEADQWLARKTSGGGPLAPAPLVYGTAKSLADWNDLLLQRAKVQSNATFPYLTNPFPKKYTVSVLPAPGTTRYVFNSRACNAWYAARVPVRINRVHFN